MNLSLLFCFLFFFLAISCGSDNDDDDNGTVNTPITNEDDREEEEVDSVVSKYTSITLKTDERTFDDELYDHSLRMDLARRPVIITGNFSDGPEDSAETCTFQISLSDEQADRLERLANDLKICSRDGDNDDVIIEYSGFDQFFVTDRSGKVTQGFKYNDPDESDLNWFCGGRNSFYRYVKSVVGPKVPDNCPSGALNKF